MPVNTVSAAFHITPVVFHTFLTHHQRKADRSREGNKEDPQDDMFYDQAFHIVKAFIRLGSHNTVESLQSFTNTHVPSPPWAAVSSVLIPLSSCNQAADVLTEWFGPEELQQVVGGQRWWQVRGLDGIEAEWVTERQNLPQRKLGTIDIGRKLSRQEELIVRMNELEPLMLYIHGGGYFWGSINTHRYQVLRYARKFHGRVFTVNYRKAPQYPWPCAIQDVLAAYLYLIDPPAHALHKPVAPNKITLAGDSAGGGLCLSLLTILRDLSRPLPAGAVLISPWVDLTHSFPSILSNMETDIIPEHGFLSKPSTLWPLDLLPPKGGRVVPSKSNPPPVPGEADTLKRPRHNQDTATNDEATTAFHQPIKTQEEMLPPQQGAPTDVIDAPRPISCYSSTIQQSEPNSRESDSCSVDGQELKPPKVLMQDPHAIPLELRSQIQLYATTEQLTHPLVSPVFQGSLGNLPPLYIIAGDAELLRDEVIYLAHRAAYPQDYPTREGILHNARRQKENVARFTKGTKVHLQIFDGMCHVPTIFSFAPNVRYVYRSIAEFVKYVTEHSTEELEQIPFPELNGHTDALPPCAKDTEHNEHAAHLKRNHCDGPICGEDTQGVKIQDDQPSKPCNKSHHYDVNSQQVSNQQNVQMIRERVDVHGRSRPMEPAEEIPALKLETSQLGILKEAPAMRWKNGQDKWDCRYKRAAVSAMKERRKLEAKAQRLIKHAYEQGLVRTSRAKLEVARTQLESVTELSTPRPKVVRRTSVGKIQNERRWGPLDLDHESPPRSAIAKRRDTPEALALLKKHIYFTAPVTHETVPSMNHGDALRASLDPRDDPNRPPRQSVSEQQQKAHVLPVHGLRIWDKIITYFGRKSTVKVVNGTKHAGDKVENVASGASGKLKEVSAA